MQADDVTGPEGAALLEVEDLATHFVAPESVVRAVDGVSLTLRRGATLGVVGESGSGKTMLARSIMGLLPARGVARAGVVRLGGRDLTSLTARQLRRVWGTDIAMVFQDPMSSLHPVRTVGAQLAGPLRRHLGTSRGEARRLAADLLGSVGLPDPARALDRYPHQFSGGMRQRVMIAIALSGRPRLLLADEPTTALDVTVQRQILDVLAHQQAERHMAVVLVTHDLGVVAHYSDDLVVMYAGRVVERAPTEVLFADVQMPYTEALFRSTPRLADPSHTPLQVMPGRPPDLARLPVGCSFAPRCPYARERCHVEAPTLRPVGVDGDHLVACWYPIGARPGPQAASGGDSPTLCRTTPSGVVTSLVSP